MRLACVLIAFKVAVLGPAVRAAPWEMLWDPETALTVPPYANSTEGAPCQSKVAVTSDGQVHVVWQSYRPNTNLPQIYYKRFVPGIGWTEDTCISGDRTPTECVANPAIACDLQDNLHVVWAQDYGYNIWYKMRNSAGVWDTASTLISVGSGTLPRFEPSIACTPDGHVHVIWREWYPIYGSWLVYREKVGDTWGPTCTVDSVGTNSSLSTICIVGDQNNNLHFVGFCEGPYFGFYYRCRTGTVWGPRERFILGPDSTTGGSSSLAVNPVTDEPHVVWDPAYPGMKGIYHTRKSGGVWQPRDTVCVDTSSRRGKYSLVFTRDGIGHVIWFLWYASRAYQIWYCERTVAGEWLTPTELTRDSALRNWAALSDGGRSRDSNHLYLVWTDERDTVPEVYFRHAAPGPQGIQWDEEMPLAALPTPALTVSGTGRLRYSLPRAEPVKLVVCDATGRLVRNLVNSRQHAGSYTTVWDGRDNRNRKVPGGIYFVHLKTPSRVLVGKLVLTRSR